MPTRNGALTLALRVGMLVMSLSGLLNLTAHSGALEAATVEPAAMSDNWGTNLGDMARSSSASLDQAVNQAAGAGGAWTRTVIDAWGIFAAPAGIAAQQKAPEWRNYDPLVSRARQEGLKLLAILGFRHDSSWTSNEADWRYYVRAAANHYRGQIKAYEIGNEPDIVSENSETPANYALLVQAAYEEIKVADPAALVVGGALATVRSASGERYPYLRAWFDAHRQRYGSNPQMDVFSFHQYALSLAWYRDTLLPELRAILADYGLANKPIWLTEHAAQVDDPEIGSEAAQANYVRTNLPQLLLLGFDKIFWWPLRDRGTFASDPINRNAGLIRLDGSKRPAYDAFRQMSGSVPNINPSFYDRQIRRASLPCLTVAG